MPELATTLASTDDDRLDQAEGLVRAYCGWHIGPERTTTETLPTLGGVLLLRSLHVTAVASVTLADDTVLDVADYEWTEAGAVRLLPGWATDWWYQRWATVEYTHGYAPPPAEVVGVVRAVAQRGVNNPGSLVRTQVGPFSDTYSQTGFNQSLPLALLDAEKQILDRYRIPPRP